MYHEGWDGTGANQSSTGLRRCKAAPAYDVANVAVRARESTTRLRRHDTRVGDDDDTIYDYDTIYNYDHDYDCKASVLNSS